MPTRPIPAPGALRDRRVDLPLPPYRYVPGLYPHPRGTDHGGAGIPDGCPPDRAEERAFDLLEARYVWEAHEAFEIGWRQVHEPEARARLAALVKLCAAILRAHQGDRRSATMLVEAAAGGPLTEADRRWLAAVATFVDAGDWDVLPPSAEAR